MPIKSGRMPIKWPGSAVPLHMGVVLCCVEKQVNFARNVGFASY